MAQQVEEDVLDPVCGMTISPADSVGEIEHRGHTYYFCNRSCLDRFKASPDEFVGPGAASRQMSAPDESRGGIHLPDAPRDSTAWSRLLPDLRNGARVSEHLAGRAAERRARRHDATPALVVRAHSSNRPGDGRRVSSRTADPCADQRPRPGLDRAAFWRRRSSCGVDGRSSREAGRQSRADTSICLR